MKYYLVEITTYVDDTKDSYAVYAFDDLAGAESAYHQKQAGARNNENCATEYTQVFIQGDNRPIRYEYFVRATDPEPEDVVPEPTPAKSTRKSSK